MVVKDALSEVELCARLAQLKADAVLALEAAASREAIEQIKVAYLGKKGHVSEIMKLLRELDASARRAVGQVANDVRDTIEAGIESASTLVQNKNKQESLKNSIDITLPGRRNQRGRRHPLSQTAACMLEALQHLGFELARGPEIEHDFYNFEALNIPRNHPARDMQDTFYVESDVVLRTHTSPVQIRALLAMKTPPIRIVSFGRVYRRDQDVTHSPMFHQIEGLFVDTDVTFSDLKGVLEVFIARVFQKQVPVRLRPSFFPFTEPSAEVDMQCFACGGEGCRLCKGTGWIEIMGAGMVDPAVFAAVGLDSEKYKGFAFGMGVERVAMLRYGISDIRLFYDNDIRFLEQF